MLKEFSYEVFGPNGKSAEALARGSEYGVRHGWSDGRRAGFADATRGFMAWHQINFDHRHFVNTQYLIRIEIALLDTAFVEAWRDRMVNIHPSLLPAFPGLESQRQALEHGAKFSGCTVHFVDENLDAGPIVLQACVAIEDADTPETLAERILREEHRIYTEAVRIVLEGRYRIEGRRVLLHAPKGSERK